MFERYSEKARRVIFFARYEASNYGSPYIESEHVLLGLLREDHALANRLGNRRIVEPEIRAEIETRITRLRTVLNISGGTPFGRMRERFEVRRRCRGKIRAPLGGNGTPTAGHPPSRYVNGC